MWAGCWNALIWTWKTWSSTKSKANPWIVPVELTFICHLEVRAPSQLWAQEEMRMKTWLNFSVSDMTVTPECRFSNWVLSGIKTERDISTVDDPAPKVFLIIKMPFYVESFEVIRNLLNFWPFLLRNKLPCFLKHKEKTFWHFSSQIRKSKGEGEFSKIVGLNAFNSIKSSFKMTALHFVVQPSVSQGKHLLNLTMS